MFYSTISDGTVVSCDLISQLISLSNVNTKAKAEPLAASSAHPSLLMYNWLPWKEAREGKQPAIILTPVSRNWNPLTISARMIEVVLETRGMFMTWAAFCACGMEARVCITIWRLCLISVLTLKQRSCSLASTLWASTVSPLTMSFLPSQAEFIRKIQKSHEGKLSLSKQRIGAILFKKHKNIRRTCDFRI